ncbi:MAG: DUF4097 family beta strand repeat-containing protein [Terracidiphilus sp.]|jgi:DUF4097 and DUF4098 domain-containing protein YvlB
MSSTPPIPPYDLKTQWRIQRQQQKAAWRAQRDAIKASYNSAYGPRVPSLVGPVILIAIGLVALMMATGHLNAVDFWSWYGHWWPLLLIGAGLAMLGEWALDLRREVPVRRSGSFVGILVLLGILGCMAAGWNHARPWFSQWGDHDNDFFNVFGLPEHDFDQPTQSRQIPSNAAIDIENPRGDVSVTTGDGSNVEVLAHEVAFANSDSDAKKIFDTEAPHLTVSGSSVLIKSESNSSGRINIAVTVPKSARVTVNTGKGDVTAAGLGAGINVTARGDVHLSEIAGSVVAHFSEGKHDFSAHDLQGDLTVDGNSNDITFSGIKGKVTQNGEILGDVHMENISGAIHLHTSVTDLQVADLPGDLTLNSDNLRVDEAKGQVRVVTHSKDIDLSQISGDSYVEDRDGRISVEPAGVYAVDAKNSKGDVEVTLPPNASATIDGRTRNGDIMTDYDLHVSGEESKSISGKIGAGAAKITVSTDVGDVRIKKGSGFTPKTPSPEESSDPKMLNVPPHHQVPDISKAPKLKTSSELPAQPVTQ